ncbi:hypothetical protein D0T84_16275 [Dysgonomonas sp. 521]|uniref:hypothetical protein n=1 Tax=Dysgonomonas sp. 521 TaxID=2302932 RepID=UPI0013CF5305|nr:hypothetical protein [Dysgonomonas sp. 521]NDV96458.1 hypothetical protein [Dysgonomonas sp. 521]
MPKEKTIDICHRHLFDDVDAMQKANVSVQMINRIKRIRSIYTTWNDYPMKKDKEMRDRLVADFGISLSEAYEDIKIIKQLIGDINSVSKAWHRFKFAEMITQAYETAKIKRNPMAMVMAADKYAKYNQLDKEDALEFPWDEIIPDVIEPSSDPTLIGIKPVPNIQQKIAALKKKYEAEIEDIDFVEIGIDPKLIDDIKSYGE